MNRKITILAIDEDICIFFKEQLRRIFGDLIEIDYRNTDMNPIPPVNDTDLILYADPESLTEMISIIKCQAPTLMMKRTITRSALKKIRSIPEGKRALVANINQYMANETMALIYQLGVTGITLFPYYKGIEKYPKANYIITPKDYSFLPDIKAKTILIGNRVFDISNILDIMSLLQVKRQKVEKIIRKYLLKVPSFWYGAEYSWENRRVLLTQWKILLDELTDGVIVSDDRGQIELINKKAGEILRLDRNDLKTDRLSSLIEKEQNLEVILSDREIKDELLSYQGHDLVFTMKRVEDRDNYYGKIIIFNPYTEMVEAQQKIHKKIIGKGYYSRYTYQDLLGEAPEFIQAKKISKKIAGSSSTLLLQGESGTGKEIFAGAIHNYSPRHNQPFVAVNCSTLPENLLESELFGYEEGAFTGAKKGGKIGLFERADGGTLFLDEIGDLPVKLQARLLRALEEKAIMRVGGDSIIHVNVRIIAATNMDLLSLVEEGKFRKDLFFRLNIFQLKIPPLRKRKEDIPILIDHFLKEWNKKLNAARDFKYFYTHYDWPGNIRELKNTLNYMATISPYTLAIDNLPGYIKDNMHFKYPQQIKEALLLKLLYYRTKTKKGTGRRSLNNLFNNFYFQISEMEIRELIDQLAEKGQLEIKRGRGGNNITEAGIRRLKKNHYIFPDEKEAYLERISEI